MRSPISPASASSGVVEVHRERFQPVRPVLERRLAPELAPQAFGAHFESLARQRDLVVAHDDRPGEVGKHEIGPEPRDALVAGSTRAAG